MCITFSINYLSYATLIKANVVHLLIKVILLKNPQQQESRKVTYRVFNATADCSLLTPQFMEEFEDSNI